MHNIAAHNSELGALWQWTAYSHKVQATGFR